VIYQEQMPSKKWLGIIRLGAPLRPSQMQGKTTTPRRGGRQQSRASHWATTSPPTADGNRPKGGRRPMTTTVQDNENNDKIITMITTIGDNKNKVVIPQPETPKATVRQKIPVGNFILTPNNNRRHRHRHQQRHRQQTINKDHHHPRLHHSMTTD